MTISYCQMCKINHTFCSCCSIGIGQEHIEERPYAVGDYILCGDCHLQLSERGRIEIDRKQNGKYPMITWLFKDGTTRNVSFLLGGIDKPLLIV